MGLRRRMQRSAVVILVLVWAVASRAGAAETARWLRYPAISPDGTAIAFSYHGDIWKVSAAGGAAIPLTLHPAHDTMPVWSPDGSKIAFASDRYGNLDVFVMPATGGEATRLTFHSADDIPASFTPDGTAVLFSSARLDAVASAQFPTGAQPELYEVALTGGMPRQVLTTPAMYAVFDRARRRLAYSDQKGYEMEWRKHDNSSFARDVWIWDVAADTHTRLTAFGADDRQPVWSPDEKALYYLSERSGSFNVWKLDLADPSHPVQVTDHTGHPVRFLSISRNGDLCYGYEGNLWVRKAGAKTSARLAVTVAAGARFNRVEPLDVTDQVSEFDVSPDGSEIAFVARGEVFVTSTEHKGTRRITDTPEQERSVSFSPDGRSLLYASERGGSWNLYRTDLTDPAEPAFFNATGLKESTVLATAAEEFQPHFSPDGKEIAYLEDRNTVKVLNLATGKTRTVLPGDLNYSYSDGDEWFEWSPDGQWLAVQFLSPTRWSSEVGLVKAAGGGEVVNVSRSGYEDVTPRWVSKGEVLYWLTDRHGLRAQGGGGREQDVSAAFLTRKAWDRFRLDEAEFDQLKAKEKKDEKAKGKDRGGEKGEDKKDETEASKLAEPVALELDHLDDRTARLSLAAADLAGARLSPDGETLYYLAKFEKGYDLWKYTPRSHEVKEVAKLGAEQADLALDRDGKKAFVLADHHLSTVELEAGKTSPVKASAEMMLDPQAERAYLFEHVWRQTLEKFYAVDMHGVDWRAQKAYYAQFLPFIDDDRDFAELISEMQGELDSSHSGGRFRPKRADADETAALGFFPDTSYTGEGVRIAELVEGGPLQQAGTKIRAGVVITAIDAQPLAAGANWYPLLNRKADTQVRLALLDPATGTRWAETAKAISWSAQGRLLYQRWVRSRRARVDELSGGRIGYAHIRGMNDGAYREIFDEIFGRAVDKEAIVLDTRFNGGGNLVERLTEFLSGRVYAKDVPRGRLVGLEPTERWSKPSIVVMNEGNYSDAHCFPMAYTQLGIGETVGMPVPGTCSAVWWERLQDPDLIFGIPEVGLVDMAGDLMENKHLAPTYEVDNDPALESKGRDQQLEKAVSVLLAKLGPRLATK
jgi:tricorn protease